MRAAAFSGRDMSPGVSVADRTRDARAAGKAPAGCNRETHGARWTLFIRGAVAALRGPSGSGKSTLIKALGLVTLPDSGSIAFQGRPVVSDGRAVAKAAELRRIEWDDARFSGGFGPGEGAGDNVLDEHSQRHAGQEDRRR